MGALGVGALALGDMGRDKRNISLQLWSVRDVMKSDPLKTIKALSEAGYRQVEPYGYDAGKWFGLEARTFHKMLKDHGIKFSGSHSLLLNTMFDAKTGKPTAEYLKGLDAQRELGCKYIINPWVDDKDRSPDYFKRMCEAMNYAGEHAKSIGARYGYHNHDFEFLIKDGDKLVYDTILERTDTKLVDMQMDLYWVRFANQDPMTWFNKAPGRYRHFHVKDMAKTEKRESVEIGAGAIDFQEIFDHKDDSGACTYVVELEHYRTNPLQGVAESLAALKKLRFK
jgi:sugar phosphate isomerase/epimerase